ncbi:hypothetical protein [Agrobacterium deltaense]|uniref:hypothetical protein n=1 Tax=Agrobacterium deltaense TaxID=1183412 RepID=UPI0009CEFE93|nr:hypothetical protein [Agrobacterium deltaense]CUX42340.1 conserved hypothetical protein [Agrobacterium deltaense RV3]
MTALSIWQPEANDVLPSTANTASEIAGFAEQLSNKDRSQIVSAFELGHFEMGLNHLWGKTITALKKELSTVGVGLLAEMLGRADVDEDDDVDDIVTAKDAIRLAEELGIVNSTDAIRLRHTYEILNHFSQMGTEQNDQEEIHSSEALSAFRTCVKGVLGRPKIEVAKKFVEFRNALEGETLADGDHRVEMLKGSPYFFHKLTVSVLLNAAKKNVGANLEHTLANINLLIPAMWSSLRDTERWQLGQSYAEAYSDGKTTVVGGLKSALLKVRGFDYVPENLRSDTFVKAAEAILRAHEGLNNFYNEPAPVKHLQRLGTTIPTPAIPACMTALLSVYLGNYYGVSWGAQSDAKDMLKRITPDRWQYYLNNVLQSDMRLLNKLQEDKPIANWLSLVDFLGLDQIEVKSTLVQQLLSQSKSRDLKLSKTAQKIYSEYYGKNG